MKVIEKHDKDEAAIATCANAEDMVELKKKSSESRQRSIDKRIKDCEDAIFLIDIYNFGDAKRDAEKQRIATLEDLQLQRQQTE